MIKNIENNHLYIGYFINLKNGIISKIENSVRGKYNL